MPGLMNMSGSRGFRGLATLLSVLLPLASMPAPAFAQAEANGPTADPPTVAGQLTRVSGTVSFHTADETSWQPADPNYPITSGNSLWTQPGAGASVVFASNRIGMDQSTELDIATLDQHRFVATVPQGAVFLHLRDVQPGDQVSVATPRGTVTIGQPGTYEIRAGDQATPTQVTVMQGAAQVDGSGVSSAVNAGQTATITGDSPFTAALGPAQQDPFLAAQLAAEAPPPAAGVAPPPAVAQMTGGDELQNVGTWQDTSQYGAVWYPPVASGWVPYREGHWAYVAPWGWTWVDDAPWGFAPFHYGRWIEYGGRWGWVPVAPGVAVAAPPIYAPALVAFFGVGVAVGALIASGRPVGWCPLAPFEPYHPWYRASPAYIRNVNVVNVRNVNRINVTNVYNTTPINRFANRGAATVVPSQVMSGSRPVARNIQRVSAAQLGSARPYTTSPVRPTTATAGLSPNVARQFGMAPVRSQRPAPGPVVRPTQAGAPVALRPKGGAPVVRPLITAPGAQPPRAGTTPGGAPGPAIRPQTTNGAANRPPALRPATPTAQRPAAPSAQRPAPPSAQRPTSPSAQRPATPQAPHAAAPGPAIRPQAPNGAGGTANRLPALRPATPPAARPASPSAPRPVSPSAQRPATPQAPRPQPARPQPQVERPQPARPAPQVQRPQVQQPRPAPQPHYNPPPRPAPRPAPRPESRPEPQQRG